MPAKRLTTAQLSVPKQLVTTLTSRLSQSNRRRSRHRQPAAIHVATRTLSLSLPSLATVPAPTRLHAFDNGYLVIQCDGDAL
uniref:Uncharacterized protein n=1 Tax=Plectus sambesii TaxID=2011161 RepID=A0A914W837_9BILA